eukprot:ANDGO_06701.mRNA.1 Actin-related protein 3
MSFDGKGTVIIDVGTGYTKMGYAGNVTPSYVIPTAIGLPDAKSNVSAIKGVDDLDFHIGQAAIDNANFYKLSYPVRHGQVENWDAMERFWEQCFFKYLRCDPSDHAVVLTEPPLNAPENREYTAEVMFETFGVKSMYIAVQAVLALTASWTSKKAASANTVGLLSGTVVDSGDGVTHVIPVVEGYVIGSAIRHIPLAGRDITEFIMRFIKEREPLLPAEDALQVAMRIKEKYGYVCQSLPKEFAKFDKDPSKYIKIYEGLDRRTKQPWKIDVAYEQFLGPEVFFNPEIFSSDFTTPLPQVVDQVVQACPIDTRRDLYRNIVLSGGSTMFRHFAKRLQEDVKGIVDNRYASAATQVDVNVISHDFQRYAVFVGASVMAATAGFEQVLITKQMYDEYGPSIARHSKLFSASTL